MSRSDEYWLEALGESLDAAGVPVLADEQMKAVATNLAAWSESESWGRAPVPSARDLENSEIARLKASHAEEIKRLERQLAIYRGSVARRNNVREGAVYTDGYNVMIDPNG
jgi:hypothetical protein